MLNFQEYVIEARKNPELNPKISVYQNILRRLDSAKKLSPSLTNLFVSFTSVDKLGINPRSGYRTPLGIYSYPAEYIMAQVDDSREDMTRLPFAGSSPFANIFEAKGNIIDLNSFPDVNVYYKKLTDVFIDIYVHARSKETDAPPKEELWKIGVDEIDRLIKKVAERQAYVDTPGGKFWFVTMRVSDILSRLPKTSKLNSINSSVIWNSIMRRINIDGCIDSKGQGIIHVAEPTQAVFFHKGAITKNERVLNKWEKGKILSNEIFGAFKKSEIEAAGEKLKQGSDEFVRYLDQRRDPEVLSRRLISNISKKQLFEIQKNLLAKSGDDIFLHYLAKLPMTEEFLDFMIVKRANIKTAIAILIKIYSTMSEDVFRLFIEKLEKVKNLLVPRDKRGLETVQSGIEKSKMFRERLDKNGLLKRFENIYSEQ